MAEFFSIRARRGRQGACKGLAAMRCLTLQILLTTLTTCLPSRIPISFPDGFSLSVFSAIPLLAEIPAAAAAVTGVGGGGPDTISLREALAFMATGAGLLWMLMQIYGRFVARFTRTPAIEVEFATKAELGALEKKLTDAGEARRNEIRDEVAGLRASFDKGISDLYGRINSDADRLSVSLQSIQRSLGRLETAKGVTGS